MGLFTHTATFSVGAFHTARACGPTNENKVRKETAKTDGRPTGRTAVSGSRHPSHRAPPPLIQEQERLEALVAARMKARRRDDLLSPTSPRHVQPAKSAAIRCSKAARFSGQARAVPDRACARLDGAKARAQKQPSGSHETAAPPCKRPKELSFGGAPRSNPPWGFFPCTMEEEESGGASRHRLSAPEELDDAPPDVVISRPHTPQDKRLCFGPFAFRLSPSSEVLAFLMATTPLRRLLAGKRVLELGSGLGFTGIACAAWCDCAHVRLTDGDPQAVSQISKNVEFNRPSYGSTSVDAAELPWGAKEDDPGGDYGLADVIFAADCVYDCALHTALCQTIKRWLKPSGCTLSSRRAAVCAWTTLSAARGEFGVGTWPANQHRHRRFRAQKCFPSVMTRSRRGRGAASTR